MDFRVWTLAALLVVLSGSTAAAQLQPESSRSPGQQTLGNPTELPTPPQGGVEVVKIDTNLVTVPVIASSRAGHRVTDLRKEEFRLAEDGVTQEIAFLAAVNVPFHVVLMIDTSDSTQSKLARLGGRRSLSSIN